jgi:hypothetical protein
MLEERDTKQHDLRLPQVPVIAHRDHAYASIKFKTVGFCSYDVPVATQTRLSFDVILPLWGRRGPR